MQITHGPAKLFWEGNGCDFKQIIDDIQNAFNKMLQVKILNKN